MFGKKLLILVALLSSYALGHDNADVPYVFTDNDLLVLRRIPQIQVNGMGKKIDETPIIVVFANLRHLSHDQLSTSLLLYSQKKLQEGNMDDAFSVVGYFADLEETNSCPYVYELVHNQNYAGLRSPGVHSYLSKGGTGSIVEVKNMLTKGNFTAKERGNIYRFCATALQVGTYNCVLGDTEKETLCHTILLDSVERESDSRTQGCLDHSLCKSIPEWKQSSQRITALQNWFITATTEGDKNYFKRELARLLPEEALGTPSQEIQPPSASTQGESPSTGEPEKRENSPSTRPLAISAIAIALLGIAGFLWRRRKR